MKPNKKEIAVKDKAEVIGRPTKYSETDILLVTSLGNAGCNKSTFCKVRGISRSTFHEWQKAHPEFKEAVETAMEGHEAYYMDLLRDIAEGEKKGSVAAVKEILDRTHGSVKGQEASKTEINIGSMNVLQTLSEEDLQARIAALGSKLNIKEVIDSSKVEDGD